MISLILSVFRMSAPIILAATGGLLSERAGVVQIGLEGMMLIGALGASVTALWISHSDWGAQYVFMAPWLGFFASLVLGSALASISAFFSIERRANGVIVGTALNILAAGLCPFITKILFDTTGSTLSLDLPYRWTFEPILITIAVALGAHAFFYSTRNGLLLRFAGEKSAVLLSSGYSVRRVRWFAVLGCGALAGGAGSFLSLAMASNYSPNMTSGRGFIALAALICGKWRPLPTVIVALVFGLMEALQIQLQPSGTFGSLMQVLPYVATIVALAGLLGKSTPPSELS